MEIYREEEVRLHAPPLAVEALRNRPWSSPPSQTQRWSGAQTWKRSKRGAEAEDMKTAVDKGGSVGKRNRSALADVTNSKISTRASARAAQEKVQSDAPCLDL